jgi:peptidoglycan/xylan/chitin deacetylase (PgdA/CDA1 family)
MKGLAKSSVIRLADTSIGRRLLLSGSNPFVPIFMLHRFSTPDGLVKGHEPGFVREALAYVRQLGLEVISIDDVADRCLDGTFRGNAVVFTIDDGYYDQGEVGAELFLEYDCPVTIYVATGLVGGTFLPVESQVAHLFDELCSSVQFDIGGTAVTLSPDDPEGLRQSRHRWVAVLKDLTLDRALAEIRALADRLGVEQPIRPLGKYRGMCWDDMAKLEARGVSFGPHTMRHVTLSVEDDATSRSELAEADVALRAYLRSPSRVYCYPTGRRQDYGTREVGYLRELGYVGAVNTEPEYFDARRFSSSDMSSDIAPLFHIARFGMPQNMVDFKDIVLQTLRLRAGVQRRLRRTPNDEAASTAK